MIRTCVIGLLAIGALTAADSTTATTSVTYTKDIAPIFQAKCEECHHAGTNAPMSLTTYTESRPWAKSIKQRVATHQMPPWHLDKTVGIQEFANDRSLNDTQIAKILAWVDAGAPQGDPKDMPAAKVWSNSQDWQLAKVYGQPDLVIKSSDYTMPAHGQDVWWKPVTEVPVTEPRWVRAVEMRPASPAGRKITHHSVASLQQDEPGNKDADAGDDDPASMNPGGILMEWAIGKTYDTYRPNAGKLLLPGARIVWDIHYHAIGERITDHSELAVYLYPKGQEPKYRTVLTNWGAIPRGQRSLDIPPNTVTKTEAFHVLKNPARIENFQPHMHLRGKAMSMEAILPDGTTRMLSYVNNFNFNWMNNYIYTDESAPVLPRGTVIKITAWYDNTAANPNNPDPNQWVGQGDRTVDEMGHAWVNVTYITDQDYKDYVAAHKKPKQMASAAAGQ